MGIECKVLAKDAKEAKKLFLRQFGYNSRSAFIYDAVPMEGVTFEEIV